MAVLYNIASHPMLTPAVKEIASSDAPRFNQMVLLAESLLGLDAVYTVQRSIDLAKLALALQVNFQQLQGIDPFIQKSGTSSQTKQSVVFRDNALVDPRAAQIIASIVTAQEDSSDRFDVITSLRAE